MVLDWFGKGGDVSDLIARGKHGKAIEVLESRIRQEGPDPRARLQLADVLVMDGKAFDAVPILLDLADDFAAEGQAAKAIALLKKVERLDPGRRDVDVKLASLIKSKDRLKRASGWAPREGLDKAGYEPSGATFSAEHFEARPVVSDAQRIDAARSSSWVPSTHAEEEAPPPIPSVPAAQPASATQEVVASPLFSGFSQDELVAVIRGLRLLSFEPGDIVLSEGDPGDSLFVLTTGVVKTFIKDPASGRQVLVRQLGEGEFFGEISILSGKPRTATVTAAARCEMLELDRATLDSITRTHSRVRDILEEFYIARATTQEEALRRGRS